MLTQDEKLKKIYEDFGNKIMKIAEESIGDMVGSFLPYAAEDLESNVYSYSRKLIEAFLTDTLTYEWQDLMDIFGDLNSENVRRKMLVDYRDEIINQIIEDQEKEIERLKKHNTWLEELNSSRRY